MQITFNFSFKGLDGKDVKGDNANKTLASTLAALNKGNSIKLWDWAQKWYNDKTVELDFSDTEVLIGLIETAENLTALAKAQLLTHIDENKAVLKRAKA